MKGKSAIKRFFAYFLLIISILVLVIALTGRGGKEERPDVPSIDQQETPVSQPQRVQEETPPQAQEGEYATVIEVVDGDTIKVRFPDGRMEALRYIGINAPEMGQPYASEARAFNASLISGKEVRLERDVSERDKYGRLLRYVYVGSLFVNAELVAKGYANAATYPPDVKYADYFVSLEAQARNNSLGLWAISTQPSTTTQAGTSSGDIIVYITKTGEKYHRDGCRSLSKSKIPISLAEAKARGYEPCSVCNPPR